MGARKILDESDPLLARYQQADLVQRRFILKETLNAFENAAATERYHLLAEKNLRHWQKHAKCVNNDEKIQLIQGDWGDVTYRLTKKYGACFAVLNMANAYIPGGGYIEGLSAQEENMFRRTDCHFNISTAEYDDSLGQYTPAMTELLSAKYEVVYLDREKPRVCIRGPENPNADDLGYQWLNDEDIFSFYEIRAAAQDMRGGLSFNTTEARQRIIAQLDSLRVTGIRHAVLGAFGCGAFQNPAAEVAKIYQEEINKRIDDYDVIAFAIFSSGNGRDNYTQFMKILGTK